MPAQGDTQVSKAMIPVPVPARKLKNASRRRPTSNSSRWGCFAVATLQSVGRGQPSRMAGTSPER